MALTQEQLLDAWRSALPSSYTAPLEEENDGRGFDVIAACAAVLARVAAASETTTQAMYLLPHSIQTAPESAGAEQATGNLILRRAAPADGDIELEEGDVLAVELVTLDGETIFEVGLELAADLTLASGAAGPTTAAVRAARAGYQGNVEDTDGRSVTFLRRTVATMDGVTSTAANALTDSGSGDQFDEGMVDAFVVFTSGPNLGSGPRRIVSFTEATSTVVVDGAALIASAANSLRVVDVNDLGITAELDGDLTGGVHGWLDKLGKERGLGRNASEIDAEYRDRVRDLPDLVAPNSLERAARRILQPIPINYRIMESRDREQFPGEWGGAVDAMACDDPNVSIFPEDQHQNFPQGDRFERQGFYVVVERQGYGDPGWPAGIKFPGGVHPSNAVDHMACDGAAFGFWADMRRLVEEIEKTRSGGMPWLLVLVDSIP